MKKHPVSILVISFLLLLTGTTKAQEKTIRLSHKTCAGVVIKILESSPRFKQLTKNLLAVVKKNNGTGYGVMLDASPNPGRDEANAQSDNYELSLHESYPDKITNIAHFEFNPQTKLLYEINEADPDKPKLISFDKKLLVEFKKVCK